MLIGYLRDGWTWINYEDGFKLSSQLSLGHWNMKNVIFGVKKKLKILMIFAVLKRHKKDSQKARSGGGEKMITTKHNISAWFKIYIGCNKFASACYFSFFSRMRAFISVGFTSGSTRLGEICKGLVFANTKIFGVCSWMTFDVFWINLKK